MTNVDLTQNFFSLGRRVDNNTVLGRFDLKSNNENDQIEDGLNWFIANFFTHIYDGGTLNSYYIIDCFDYKTSNKMLLLSENNGLIFDNREKSVEKLDLEKDKVTLKYFDLDRYDEEKNKVIKNHNISKLSFKLKGWDEPFEISSSDIISRSPKKELEEIAKILL